MIESDSMVIYMVLNHATEMSYIGATTGPLALRMHEHKREAKRCARKKRKMNRFHAAVNEFGWECFETVVLERCKTPEELAIAEQKWVDYFDTTDPHVGYNGKRPNGIAMTEARRQQFREWGKLGAKHGIKGATAGRKASKTKFKHRS